MLWTAAQKERLLLAYAHEGEAYCPIDGSLLISAALGEYGLHRSAVNLRCPHCGAQLGPVGTAPTPRGPRLATT